MQARAGTMPLGHQCPQRHRHNAGGVAHCSTRKHTIQCPFPLTCRIHSSIPSNKDPIRPRSPARTETPFNRPAHQPCPHFSPDFFPMAQDTRQHCVVSLAHPACLLPPCTLLHYSIQKSRQQIQRVGCVATSYSPLPAQPHTTCAYCARSSLSVPPGARGAAAHAAPHGAFTASCCTQEGGSSDMQHEPVIAPIGTAADRRCLLQLPARKQQVMRAP